MAHPARRVWGSADGEADGPDGLMTPGSHCAGWSAEKEIRARAPEKASARKAFT